MENPRESTDVDLREYLRRASAAEEENKRFDPCV